METQEKYEMVKADVQLLISKQDIDNYLFSSGTKLTEQQKNMFYQVAHINNLNPFKREVYAIPYGDRFNIITGYEVYLKRAERSGKLDGWEADVSDDGKQAWCTVYRKDWSKPLTIKVWAEEYNLGNSMWKSKPKTMLRKVAIAQAFRTAFPEEIGGLPYTADEIPLEGEVIKPTEKTQAKQNNQPFESEISKLPKDKQPQARERLKQYLTAGESNPTWEGFIAWVRNTPKPQDQRSTPKTAKDTTDPETPKPEQLIDCPNGGQKHLEYCREICTSRDGCPAIEGK